MASELTSDSGARLTVTANFKLLLFHKLQSVAQTLFEGAIPATVETLLLEFALDGNYIASDEDQPSFPPVRIDSSEATWESLDDFIKVVEQLASRLEGFARSGRIASVDRSIALEFIRAAAVFPGPHALPAQPTSAPSGNGKVTFTLQPQHVALTDRIGTELFGGSRKRRAVWEAALLHFLDVYEQSTTPGALSFDRYPTLAFADLNRYLSRYVLALLHAMARLGAGVSQFRMWSAVQPGFDIATRRLGNALFDGVARTHYAL